jgi:SNF2 family DNA or RNA helicase
MIGLSGNRPRYMQAFLRFSGVFKAVCAVRAYRRWRLTGTLIQNSLNDSASLLTFVGVTPFDNPELFSFGIAQPTTAAGNHAFEPLRSLVRATCLRRTKAAVQDALKLPQKTEVQKLLAFDADDHALHQFFETPASSLARKSTEGRASH